MKNEGTSAGATVVHPQLDLAAVRLPPLRMQLREVVAAAATHITIDLGAKQMVDSAGVGLLISAYIRPRKRVAI